MYVREHQFERTGSVYVWLHRIGPGWSSSTCLVLWPHIDEHFGTRLVVGPPWTAQGPGERPVQRSGGANFVVRGEQYGAAAHVVEVRERQIALVVSVYGPDFEASTAVGHDVIADDAQCFRCCVVLSSR